MSLQVWIDGRPGNEDQRLGAKAFLEAKRTDDYTQALKQHLESETRNGNDGTYGFQGVINPNSGKGLTAPKHMVGGHLTMAQKRERVRARMAEGIAPKSLAYIEGYETELISDEDAEAFEEGWICPSCIQWQGVVSNQCNWRFRGERPSDPKDWGCGYRRDIL